MCVASVIISAVAALATVVLLARWEAWRREERERQQDYSVNEWLDDAEREPEEHARDAEDGYHDADRGGREYVTVDAIKTRIADEAEATRRLALPDDTAPLRRIRPSPDLRQGRRVAEQ